MSGLQILTIGHSNHPFGTFLWLLQKHRIEALVDVRRYPVSRRNPHFSREALSASLAEENIEYIWLESLGGNRQRAKDAPPSLNRGIEDVGFRNYADYMDADESRQGVARLMDIAAARRAAIMCAERDYRNCHRRLLSDHLVANNVSIQHILPGGELEPHLLTPGAKVVDVAVTYPDQPTLFDM